MQANKRTKVKRERELRIWNNTAKRKEVVRSPPFMLQAGFALVNIHMKSQAHEELAGFDDFLVITCKVPANDSGVLAGTDYLPRIKLKFENS